MSFLTHWQPLPPLAYSLPTRPLRRPWLPRYARTVHWLAPCTADARLAVYAAQEAPLEPSLRQPPPPATPSPSATTTSPSPRAPYRTTDPAPLRLCFSRSRDLAPSGAESHRPADPKPRSRVCGASGLRLSGARALDAPLLRTWEALRSPGHGVRSHARGAPQGPPRRRESAEGQAKGAQGAQHPESDAHARVRPRSMPSATPRNH